uniref:Secreted protein n=1 Tax=Papio anubis TaxID=9555 RepID=A0A8I5R7Q4_PAPAN
MHGQNMRKLIARLVFLKIWTCTVRTSTDLPQTEACSQNIHQVTEMESHSVAQAVVHWQWILVRCNFCLLDSRDSPTSASQTVGTTGMCHCARLIFVFLLEVGFHPVGQAGLILLTSSDPPSSASQSAGIIGVNHHTQPVVMFHNKTI